jgi:hypothetical protein
MLFCFRMIQCAYCRSELENFNSYKVHLKILHNKRTYGDKLICGQNGCILDYTSFQSLKNHCIRHHGVSHCNQLDNSEQHVDKLFGVTITNDALLMDTACAENSRQSPPTLMEKMSRNGDVLHEAAVFISRLRNHLTLSLSTSQEIINICSDMIQSIMSDVTDQVADVLKKHNIDETDSVALFDYLNRLKKPFSNLDTCYKQNKYFESKGLYIAPTSFSINQAVEPVITESAVYSRTKLLTGEYISQQSCLKAILSLPGVFSQVESYLKSEPSDGLICDFKDAALWKTHPLRLKYEHCDDTLVIPVFDFYDDIEVANPLGSHATIHKLGAKYTIVKGFKPWHNSRLENILLNTLVYAADRTAYTNSAAFDAYITEMHQLESRGFKLDIDGKSYTVFVVLVQVTGDNLGLNGVLGFVESFSAGYPCRLCKLHRDDFSTQIMECDNLLRNRESYAIDIEQRNPSESGIKEECCYNKIGSYHVCENVYCDIMHDLFEGVCRYVLQKLLKYFIFDKKFFSYTTLATRMKFFKFDHSSVPSCPSERTIKEESFHMGAIEMLNVVLGLPLIIGSFVPEGDKCWNVFLLLRQVVLISMGLSFSLDELKYMGTVVAEFIHEYCIVFQSNATIKFHNLTHYPSIIRSLGPMYNMWCMRCEAKHAKLKKVAVSSGCFKNVCKTAAVRHQMCLADRLVSQKGLDDDEVTVTRCDNIMLCDLLDGEMLSSVLGNYGLYREIFRCNQCSFNGTEYNVGDIIITGADDLMPVFVQITHVFLNDALELMLVCKTLLTVAYNAHYQAYQVSETSENISIAVSKMGSLLSPWPLACRNVDNTKFVSLRHKL